MRQSKLPHPSELSAAGWIAFDLPRVELGEIRYSCCHENSKTESPAQNSTNSCNAICLRGSLGSQESHDHILLNQQKVLRANAPN
jgi:hypothetical protein